MSNLPTPVLVLWLAIVFDLLIGDPPNVIHPVAWLGQVISAFERLAPQQGRWVPLLAGGLFVVIGVIAVSGLGLLVQSALGILPDFITVLGMALALKCTFSIHALARAGGDVHSAL